MTERKYILREILFTGGDGNVPSGGAAGQFLRKQSSTDFDTGWVTLTVASLTGVTATTTEVNYLTGVTSNIQTQLDSKVGGTLASGRIYVGNGLNVATAVDVTGDVLISNAGVTSIASGVIVNADINASAAIAHDKMAALTASRAMVTDGSGFASASAVTGTELGYLSGVTSSLQTQLNAKLGTTLNSGQLLVGNGSNVATAVTISGDITISNAGVAAISSGVIVNADINASAAIDLTKLATLTASRALVSTAGGVISASSVTSTELGYVSGVTSAIQSQLDDLIATQPVNAIVKTPTGTEDGYAITWDNTAGEYTLLDPVAQGLPTGGTARQYLIKQSGTNFDATFDNPVVSDITDLTASAGDINLLAGAQAAGLTSTEIQYLIGVTSNIQAQITQKQDRSLPHNAIWVGNGSNVPTALPAGTNGYVLTISSGVPTWQPSVSGFSNPMTTEGDLIIGDTGGSAIRLGIGTNGQVLTSDGTTASWSTPVYVTDGDKGDITVSGSGATWTVDANINKAWSGTHSFVDGNLSIIGSSDATKIAKFEVDGLTTATTRTFTLPDNDGTVALTSDLSGWLTGTLTGNIQISDNATHTFRIGDSGANQGILDFQVFAKDYLVIRTGEFASGNHSNIFMEPSGDFAGLEFSSYDSDSNKTEVFVGTGTGANFGFTVRTGNPTASRKFQIRPDGVWHVDLGSDATGDTYYRNSSGYFTRLPIGTEGTILRAGSSVPAYSTFTIPDTISALSTFVANSANVLTEITPAAGQSIRVNAGGTAWEAYTPGGGGSSVLSDITAATGSNTINSGANHQIWDWNSLTSGTGMSFRSSSTGADSNTLKVVSIEKSGANANSSQTTTALNVSNTSTGTSATNIAGHFTASGGTNNYALDIDGDIRISDNDNSNYYTIAKGALNFDRTLTWPSMSSNAYIVGVNATGLAANRIVYTANSSGFAQTSANLTYNGSLLAVNNPAVFGATSITSGADFDVNGNVIFSGSSRYLNFGTTAGSSGYGIRDNAGVIEHKNSGGQWQSMTRVYEFYGFQHNATTDGKSKFFTVDFANGFVANIGSANNARNLFLDDNSADSQDRSIIVHFYINLTKSDGSDSTSAEYVVAFRNDGGTISKVGTEVEIMKVGNATPTFSFSVATYPQVTVADNGSGGWNYRIWALVARQ